MTEEYKSVMKILESNNINYKKTNNKLHIDR
jgi:hypothetical protein